MGRRNRQGVLLPALLASIALHAVLYLPVRSVLREHLMGASKKPEPVKMVRLSDQAWSEAMERARQAKRPRRPGAESNAASPEVQKAIPKRPKPPEKKPEPPPSPRGQIVDVPATRDDSPNPDAKYLGKYNSNVEKESVARLENRDRSKKRRSHKLRERSPTARQKAPEDPGMNVQAPSAGGGTGGQGDQNGKGQGKKSKGGKKRFALEVPDLRRRDPLELKLSDLPDFGQNLNNRTASEEVRGNSDRFRLELGDRNARGDSDGDTDGAEAGAPGLPTLDQLRPTLGTVGRVAGSPSSDYVEKVPEGEGTFLNTKEFKYATFFIRVKDSVEGHWIHLFRQEYRRRDPTGRVYGQRNRSTLVTVVLDESGRLGQVQVAESSGLDFLDRAALEAFKRAQPFPNPPEGIVEEGKIRFNFQFVVVNRPSGPFGGFGGY